VMTKVHDQTLSDIDNILSEHLIYALKCLEKFDEFKKFEILEIFQKIFQFMCIYSMIRPLFYAIKFGKNAFNKSIKLSASSKISFYFHTERFIRIFFVRVGSANHFLTLTLMVTKIIICKT